MKLFPKELSQKKAVTLLKGMLVQSEITERQYEMYEYKRSHDFQLNGSRNETAQAQNVDGFRSEDRCMNIDEWLAFEEKTQFNICAELRKHFDSRSVHAVLEQLKPLTIVPEMLTEQMNNLDAEMEVDPFDLDPFPPENPNILKMQILEAYIAQNDFDKKSRWNNDMQRQYEQLVKLDAFSKPIMEVFYKAVQELKNELTLAHIREIKKYLEENEE